MAIKVTPAKKTQDGGLAEREVWRHEPLKAGVSEPDLIAVEAPIALQFNGISHAVLLATPLDLDDLAVGFAFTEGIVRDASDIYDVQVHESEQGHIVDIDIASACLQRLKQRRRQLAGRTGCGLCGLESLEEVRRDLEPVPTPAEKVHAEAVFIALKQLGESQTLHQQTGATHAAGLAQPDGRVVAVREDVGRHNALDKLIGHLIRTDGLTRAHEQMIVVSSRASFEMVQKTASAKIPTLVAVSAPTSFAIKLAAELNLLLVGFGRSHQFSAYSHPHRLFNASDYEY